MRFVESPTVTRVWRVCKESGLEFPLPDGAKDDPYIAYLINEAVMLRVKQEDLKAQKEAEEDAKKREWKEMPLGSKAGQPT